MSSCQFLYLTLFCTVFLPFAAFFLGGQLAKLIQKARHFDFNRGLQVAFASVFVAIVTLTVVYNKVNVHSCDKPQTLACR